MELKALEAMLARSLPEHWRAMKEGIQDMLSYGKVGLPSMGVHMHVLSFPSLCLANGKLSARPPSPCAHAGDAHRGGARHCVGAAGQAEGGGGAAAGQGECRAACVRVRGKGMVECLVKSLGV